MTQSFLSRHLSVTNDLIEDLKKMPMNERKPWRDQIKFSFQCNICSGMNEVTLGVVDRESQDCVHCLSYVRMRTMVHLISLTLFDRSLPIDEFPRTKKLGIGLSDWQGYAERLEKKLPGQYMNTFYDQAPQLDINQRREEWKGKYDFITATDVFEHTNPPASYAFENAYFMLKPGGTLIFSVPFSLEENTIEHFPRLHDHQLIKTQDGKCILQNKTTSGEIEYYSNLIFHGAAMGGDALEKRVYSQKALTEILTQVGFRNVRKADDTYLKYGIIWWNPWSTYFVAVK